uniref:Uncharacterized protein n=1 Tax=Anguilla anguilla TaxID=7936 RepID=A0A0E9S9V2_ANGAN
MTPPYTTAPAHLVLLQNASSSSVRMNTVTP